MMKSAAKICTEDLPAYAETDYPTAGFWLERDPIAAHGQIPFRARSRRELYDQTRDQGAEHNLAAALRR